MGRAIPNWAVWIALAIVAWYVYVYYFSKRGGAVDAAASISNGALSY
jgi:hypothetical protein